MTAHHLFPRSIVVFTTISLAIGVPMRAAAVEADALRTMTIEELLSVDVSTASRRPESLHETAAAAYVITRDAIHRSGATTIPDALRLAPGVEVAQVGAHSWAVSMRGFNGDLSNKLLVLIDGRSVYSPLFAGVFWDVQNYLMADIERIEVIEGPGGTLWGANAVNGVINIITRSAFDTLGTRVEIGGGNEERSFGSARFSTRLGDDGAIRGYVKAFDQSGAQRLSDGESFDDWRMTQGGFRSDSDVGDTDVVTLQGDAYEGEEGGESDRDFTLGTLPTGPRVTNTQLDGANLLGRWTHASNERSELALQVYWDRTSRAIPRTYNERRDTTDIDLQQRLNLGAHDFVWGLGARRTSDELHNTVFASFVPPDRTDWTYSGFVQDQFSFANGRARLTLGSKLEHNNYTGYEPQPNARFAWLASDRQTWWAAVSQAVRIPARLDADIRLTVPLAIPGIPIPVYARINGSDNFDSERLTAYEGGWRMQVRPTLSLDLSLFYNDYDDLATTEPLTPLVEAGPNGPYLLLPNVRDNRKEGESYGGTLLAQWQPIDTWRLQFQYSYLEVDLDPKSGTLDPTIRSTEGNSPEHQVGVQSYADLPHDITFFAQLRYVDKLPALGIHQYTELAMSFSWQATSSIELRLSGRNLLDPRHPEFGSGDPLEIERSIYGSIVFRR